MNKSSHTGLSSSLWWHGPNVFNDRLSWFVGGFVTLSYYSLLITTKQGVKLDSTKFCILWCHIFVKWSCHLRDWGGYNWPNLWCNPEQAKNMLTQKIHYYYQIIEQKKYAEIWITDLLPWDLLNKIMLFYLIPQKSQSHSYKFSDHPFRFRSTEWFSYQLLPTQCFNNGVVHNMCQSEMSWEPLYTYSMWPALTAAKCWDLCQNCYMVWIFNFWYQYFDTLSYNYSIFRYQRFDILNVIFGGNEIW